MDRKSAEVSALLALMDSFRRRMGVPHAFAVWRHNMMRCTSAPNRCFDETQTCNVHPNRIRIDVPLAHLGRCCRYFNAISVKCPRGDAGKGGLVAEVSQPSGKRFASPRATYGLKILCKAQRAYRHLNSIQDLGSALFSVALAPATSQENPIWSKNHFMGLSGLRRRRV